MPRPSLHARPVRPPFRPNPRERRPRVGVVGATGNRSPPATRRVPVPWCARAARCSCAAARR
jgi:hypothetical protein